MPKLTKQDLRGLIDFQQEYVNVLRSHKGISLEHNEAILKALEYLEGIMEKFDISELDLGGSDGTTEQ